MTPAERAYLLALEAEARGHTEEAIVGYQALVETHGPSLWSDSAVHALDRIASGVPVSVRLSQGRAPFGKRLCRPLSFWHATGTIATIAMMAAIVGPLVAGSWLVILALHPGPLLFIYLVGGLPAAIAGLLFSGWVLCFCHLKGFMPNGTVWAGILCGGAGVATSAWALMPLFFGDVLPSDIVIFLVVHGMVGGAVVGWLGGKMIWSRMDPDASPLNRRAAPLAP